MVEDQVAVHRDIAGDSTAGCAITELQCARVDARAAAIGIGARLDECPKPRFIQLQRSAEHRGDGRGATIRQAGVLNVEIRVRLPVGGGQLDLAAVTR